MTSSDTAVGFSATGVLIFTMVGAAPLTLLCSMALLKLYRRAVSRSMRTRIAGRAPPSIPPDLPGAAAPPAATEIEVHVRDGRAAVDLGADARALGRDMRRRRWSAALVAGLSGCAFAAVMTLAEFAGTRDLGLSSWRFLWLFGHFAWPIALALILMMAGSRPVIGAILTVYFLVVLGVGVIAAQSGASIAVLARGWFGANAVPTAFLPFFFGRRIRSVGPLLAPFFILAVLGAHAGLVLLGVSPWFMNSVERLGTALDLSYGSYYVLLVAPGLAGAVAVGIFIMKRAARRYAGKITSDQTIQLDALWLLFALLYSMQLASSAGGVWVVGGLAAFGAGKLIAGAGNAVRRRLHPPPPNTRLLLLRAFSLGRRSERLLDALGKHWRYVGSIQLIAGPDLATSTIEPHEFLDFVSGKLARRFVDGAEGFERRLAESDFMPDRDGRFRVNDFFCHDDTWKMVMTRLAGESDVVLMDLRGFTPSHAGCVFEVEALIERVPLSRVVFMTDDTTDEGFLRATARRAWARHGHDARPEQPPPRLLLQNVRGSGHQELRPLLMALCAAAGNAAPARQTGSAV